MSLKHRLTDTVSAHAAVDVATARRRVVGFLSENPTVEAQLGADNFQIQAVQPLSLLGGAR